MDERRKFPRYSEHLNLELFLYNPKITPSKITNFKARTIDVSRGGFRMESNQELTTGSIVGFRSNDDISSDMMPGIGEVKWCNHSRKSGYFEYGISTL